MKQIFKLSIIFFSLFLYGCSTKDDPATQNTSNSDNLNLDFESRSSKDASLPAVWYTGTLDQNAVGGDIFQISLDDLEKHSGNLSLKMEMTSAPNGKFGVFMNPNTLPIEDFAGKSVLYSGWIKTKNVNYVDKNGALGLWFRVDGANNETLGFGSTYSIILEGDNNWKFESVKIDVSKDAKAIYFGGVFAAKGTVWFDNLQLSVNGTKY